MSSNIPIIIRLLASSVSIAGRAGKIVRDVMSKGELGIVEKGKNDYQTEADRSAQRCIISSLASKFPNLKIIGEEEALPNEPTIPSEWVITEEDDEMLAISCPGNLTNVKEEDIVVWVDPLDGTAEYTQGFLEHVTVLIGISVNETPIAGVIHQPFYQLENDSLKKIGRTIWGLQDVGVGGFVLYPPPSSLIITTTRSHSNPTVEKALQAMNASQVLRVGGAGYKVLQLLEGKASVYLFASPGCKKWDTCAPEAVLRAAGGVLSDVRGRPYRYGASAPRPNSAGVLAAASPQLHAQALEKIPVELKEKLAPEI